jgi:hypothetical protein
LSDGYRPLSFIEVRGRLAALEKLGMGVVGYENRKDIEEEASRRERERPIVSQVNAGNAISVFKSFSVIVVCKV